jgi:hypothetical protein
MAGVWGVVSGKFILSAVGLILASRVGQDRVEAVIDPARNVTEISTRLAQRLHLTVEADRAMLRHSLTVGISAEQFDLSAIGVADQLPAGIDLRLGQDVLRQHVFAIDLRRNALRLVIPGDYRHDTRNLAAVPVSLATDGGVRLPATLRDGQRLDVFLNLASPYALCVPRDLTSDAYREVRIGPLMIARLDIHECPVGTSVTLGLKAFGGEQLVLDLPHEQLWVASK